MSCRCNDILPGQPPKDHRFKRPNRRCKEAPLRRNSRDSRGETRAGAAGGGERSPGLVALRHGRSPESEPSFGSGRVLATVPVGSARGSRKGFALCVDPAGPPSLPPSFFPWLDRSRRSEPGAARRLRGLPLSTVAGWRAGALGVFCLNGEHRRGGPWASV